MRHHWTKCLPLILAMMLPMAACDDNEMAGPEDGMATLSVYLTDALGDVANVWVELVGLTAQGGEGGPVELLGEPTDLILLTDLVGVVQLLQVNADLDPTTISQLRLVIGDAVLEASDGTVYVKGNPVLPEGLDPENPGELHCPSCSQSGIKVKVPNDEVELEEGEAALVLDFDVAQSFGHKAGKSGKWVMKPVIHGTLVGDEDGDGDVLDELGLTNSITGAVALGTGFTIPECPAGEVRSIRDFIPTATANLLVDGENQPIVRAGAVAEDGTFQIGFLSPDSYTMGFDEVINLGDYQLTFTATVAPGQVTVPGPDVTGVTYTISAAECTASG